MRGRLLRNALIVSLVLSASAVIGGVAIGQVRHGLALGVGLLIGSANGLLIQRSVALGAGFTALSLARLMLLTMVGLVIGLLFGLSSVWLVIAGIAVAQLVLAGWAVREALAG